MKSPQKCLCELPPPRGGGPVDLLVIAAEQSGDEHGAYLVRQFLGEFRGASVCAVGGLQLAQEKTQFLYNLTDHAAMGTLEVIKNIRFFSTFLDRIVDWICRFRPRRVCFIDSPALNLRIAERLYLKKVSHRGGGDVFLYHYIAPQVWAWRANRRFLFARYLDALGVIFPFELDSFRDTTLPTTFVGHPFLESGEPSPLHYENNRTVFLLPGSREQCIRRIYPTQLAAFQQLADSNLDALTIYPSEKLHNIMIQLLKNFPKIQERVRFLSLEEALQAPPSGRAAIMTSGTMSLRCALEGIPGVILYKTNPFTYWLGKRLIKVHHLGIANLLLGYELYPEYVQQRAQPGIISQRMEGLLHGRAEFAEVAEELKSILRKPHPSLAEWLRTTV